MRSPPLSFPLALLALSVAGQAAEPQPEIERAVGRPQAIDVVHTVRGIPEACVRLEGRFTGDRTTPYRLSVVRTAPNCRARARFVEFQAEQPSTATGWKLNDRIRVPSAACATQQAVVRVWRKPGEATPPQLDAQGRARIYLQDAVAQAKSRDVPHPALYAAEMSLEGRGCGD